MRVPLRLSANLAYVLLALASIAGTSCARASDVVEETSVNADGVVESCGDGDGLGHCRDAAGETWQHADDPDYIKLDSTQELEQSSEQIRNESPKQLERTIQDIEDDGDD